MTTSISSAKEEDEHLEMDIDLRISSQRSEKEDEHIEKMDTIISARLPENEHVMIGTTGSADSDDGVSQPSCSEEDEDRDNGSDSEADCFSTISLEDDAVHSEEEESLELGIDCSTEGVELRLGEIEEGSPDDVHVDLDPASHLKPPKGRSIAHSAFSDRSAVFLLLDIEIGGEHAGFIQL